MAMPIPSDAFIHRCLHNVTRLIPGATGVYYLVDEQLRPRQHVLAGITPETHRSYLSRFMPLDPLHPQHFNHQPVTFATLDDHFQRSEYYQQFMRPNGMADMCEVYVRRHKRIVAGLSLMRDVPFSAPERIHIRATLPLIEVASEELLPDRDHQHLTPQERIIVAMIREGACNKRIASQLDISLSTVKTHLRNIFSKVQASNRTELLRNVNPCWYA